MKESMDPLDRLLRAAARAPRPASTSDDGPLGWQRRVMAGVREERANSISASFTAFWKRGAFCAVAAAAVVASYTAWNMKVGPTDPLRMALEPSEIYLAIK
jgi:anti-sigma-K factor RskA